MDMLATFKALSDETRLRIVKVLSLHEWSVNDLVHILHLGQSRVSRHLHILDEASLVRVRRQGLWAYYQLSPFWETDPFYRLLLQRIDGEPYDTDIHEAKNWESRKKKATQEFFNEVAHRWKVLRENILGKENPLAELLQGLPRVSRCADLGCGDGESISLLLQYGERIIAIDNSSEMMALARERFLHEDRVEFRYGDIERLPMREGEVDLAIMNLTLHHLPNLQQWAEEMGRIIGNGGYLAIVDFLPHEEKSLQEIYHDHWLGLDPQQLVSLLASYGFHEKKLFSKPLASGNLTLFLLLVQKQGGAL